MTHDAQLKSTVKKLGAPEGKKCPYINDNKLVICSFLGNSLASEL